MDLPSDLQFSQGCLQDFVDCPRRFHLRHVLRLRWPAEETEPALENERYLRQGAALHRVIRQHVLGIPVRKLEVVVRDPDVRRWWQNYLEVRPGASASHRYPEITLSTVVLGHRLTARYDLVAVRPDGGLRIFDWKTYRRRPPRTQLADRMQTRVYPFVLARAWDALDGSGAVTADDISMIYWFAEFPELWEEFRYGVGMLEDDVSYLSSLVGEIEGQVGRCAKGELLPRTQDRELCRKCCYRSLCRRGVEAGRLAPGEQMLSSDDLSGFSLDVDQMAELEIS